MNSKDLEEGLMSRAYATFKKGKKKESKTDTVDFYKTKWLEELKKRQAIEEKLKDFYFFLKEVAGDE